MGVLNVLAANSIYIPAEIVSVGIKLIDEGLECGKKLVQLSPLSFIDIEWCFDVALSDNHAAMLELTVFGADKIPKIIFVKNVSSDDSVG